MAYHSSAYHPRPLSALEDADASYRHQPLHSTASVPTPTTVDRMWSTLTRLLLIADFTLVARTIRMVPYIGRLLVIAYVCLINAYYAYE